MIKSKDTRGLGTINWPNGKVYDALGSGATGVLTGQKTADDVLKQTRPGADVRRESDFPGAEFEGEDP